MSKIILCGNQNVLGVCVPSYDDGFLKPRIMIEVLATIQSDKTLRAAWDKIKETEDFKNNKISFKQILSGLGKAFEDKVRERILNYVLKKDLPLCVDTTAWPEERKNSFRKKYGLPELPEHLLLPMDQIEAMKRDGQLAEGEYTTTQHMVVEEKDYPEVSQRGDYKSAYCFCPKKGFTVNIGKAREVCKNQIRKARKEVFKTLDWKVSKALARGNQPDALTHEERREYWRNLTEDSGINKAKSIDELKAFVSGLPVE